MKLAPVVHGILSGKHRLGCAFQNGSTETWPSASPTKGPQVWLGKIGGLSFRIFVNGVVVV
jgi:hypothetical protein